MGAKFAVSASNNASFNLNNFNDVLIVKLKLNPGSWVVMARVVLYNYDGDLQTLGAKLVHDANVVIDRVDIWANARSEGCVYLQGTLTTKRDETIELICSTYKGMAQSGSLIAFDVDNIEVQ
jgi:hypothetical protein